MTDSELDVEFHKLMRALRGEDFLPIGNHKLEAIRQGILAARRTIVKQNERLTVWGGELSPLVGSSPAEIFYNLGKVTRVAGETANVRLGDVRAFVHEYDKRVADGNMLAEQMKATAHQAVETEKKYAAHVADLTERAEKLRAERDELSRQLLEVRNPLSNRAARVIIRFLERFVEEI